MRYIWIKPEEMRMAHLAVGRGIVMGSVCVDRS